MSVVEPLRATLDALFGRRRAAFLGGLTLALVLAPLDLGRQLLVRDDPSRLHALLVDVIGVLTATVGQLALVGALSGRRRWLSGGTRLTLEALRRRPVALLAGLVAAGAVSAVLTLPASVAVLSVGQVVGPLQDPSLGAFAIATLSDAVGTAVTAPYFALLVGLLAGAGSQRDAANGARPR